MSLSPQSLTRLRFGWQSAGSVGGEALAALFLDGRRVGELGEETAVEVETEVDTDRERIGVA